MEIQLEPDLSHCIQTRAKREYGQIKSQLLETDAENPELGEKLELLKTFLESTDFNKLRSEYEPYLIQGMKVTFTLNNDMDSTSYRMEIV